MRRDYMNIVEHHMKLQYEILIVEHYKSVKGQRDSAKSEKLHIFRKLLITQYGCESVNARAAGAEIVWEIRARNRKVYMYRFNLSTSKIQLVGVRTYAMA
jgi:hypothetical protein